MTNEIAPCPMPECGGECVLDEGSYTDVCCERCGYNTGWHDTADEAIAAHNALAADVTLARTIRQLARQVPGGVRLSSNSTTSLASANEQHRSSADTLDAALAELTAKIGGSDER